MAKMTVVTDADFDAEVLGAETPVLVDFWAAWCGPCRALSPILEEMAGEMEGQVKFVKMDVDANRATSEKYAIRSLPTLLVFKGGEIVEKHIGMARKKVIADKLAAIA